MGAGRRLLGVAVVFASVLAVAMGSLAAPGAGTDAIDLAMNYVRDNRQELGLTSADIKNMLVSSKVVSVGTGTTHVYLQQTLDGIGVHRGLLNVNVAKDGWVISAGNRFVSDLASAAGGQAKKRASEAADAAAKHVGLAARDLRTLEERSGPSRKSVLSTGGISAGPIGAELVWHPLDSGRVRLAWQVEIDERGGEHVWSIGVDAETGAVLEVDDLVDHDDVSAIRAAIARTHGGAAGATRSTLVGPATTVTDGSSYRVFAAPFESPSDGERTLVTNPASNSASPFGWHDTNGATGPEFTRTRGNNAHAYTDRNNDNVADTNTDPDAARVSTSTSRSTSAAGRSTRATPRSRTSTTGTTSSTMCFTVTASTRRPGTSR